MILKTHVGIYGLIIQDQHILLVTKTRGPYTGLLDLPGGRPEHNETPEQTLKRELIEETGIRVLDFCLFENLAHTTTWTEAGEQISLYHTGLVYRVTRYDSTHFNPTISQEDVGGAAWYPLTYLLNNQVTPFVWTARNKWLMCSR